ncbi:MAG TPA: histidine--tRNA ligase [Deltaproteobacteria bacterium]|jgi:histidyl-tRNA synthetase|nr:histidine--tRNA ligase [Candidatus Lambdaproteobacteria bacterium]HIL15955.1 histidine--tRNA ligase [Deltaproteobacteria bacterium]
MELQAVKGTRDFYPEQMRVRNWLFSIWREVSEGAGFEEYDACVLEHEDLYVRKAGDEITQQLYNFQDKSGRKLSLRPEMTPSLARMILQHHRALTFPVKWFSIPQCFRYERMTKGRRREHFQWNADIIGQPEEIAEAEILMLLINVMQKMGLGAEDITIFINDRRILNAMLEQVGIPEPHHAEVLVILDKRDKISPEALAELLREQGVAAAAIPQLQELLECPDLETLKSKLDNPEPFAGLETLFGLLEASGYGDFLRFDVSIVRGLSYYTGPVFEMNSPDKSQRAICGGGRYDSLLSTYGGETIPAVGFGFGDVVVLDVLEAKGKQPQLNQRLDVMVIPFEPDQAGTALQVASSLRKSGLRVDCNFSMRKMKKALQQADDAGVKQAVLLFPQELEQGKVVVRNMAERSQQNVALADLQSGWLTSQ